MNANGKSVIQALASSKVYEVYSRAFGALTKLPLVLRPVESWKLPYHGRKHENGYCCMLARKSSACAGCLRTQQRLSELAKYEVHTVTCCSGLSETAVPIRLGEQLLGFLQIGQVFRRPPTLAQFERIVRQAASWNLGIGRDQLRELYFRTPLMDPKEHQAAVRLLVVFSQHLALVSNQVLMQQERPDPPMIARAKDFIQEHQTEDISLVEVAKAVNTSTFYFCKVFKKSTGLNFTDYVSRMRIEKAKNLALNPNLRISEIAFEVGFQSLTHFNRVFKRVTGMSPTEYRAQLSMV
jgi:AraC-like DNA-binding protein